MNLKSVLVLGLICGLSASTFAFQRGNELSAIPNAKMEKTGYLEVGGGAWGGYQSKNGGNVQADIFLRTVLARNFEYGITDSSEQLVHHLQIGLDPLGDENQSFHVAFGLKNIGWTSPNSGLKSPATVVGGFLSTSFQIQNKGAWMHLGIAESKSRGKVVGFAGIEFNFPIGDLSAEWDGELYSFGYKTFLFDRLKFTSAFLTRFKAENSANEAADQFRIGLSLVDSPDIVKREQDRIKEKAEKASADAKQLANPLLPTLNIKPYLPTPNTLTKTVTVNTLSTLNAEQRVQKSVRIMERANRYYYQGQFIDALGEYMDFIQLNPNLASGYVSVGSIYYQLNMMTEAKTYWKKALKIDPENAVLKAFLTSKKIEL